MMIIIIIIIILILIGVGSGCAAQPRLRGSGLPERQPDGRLDQFLILKTTDKYNKTGKDTNKST